MPHQSPLLHLSYLPYLPHALPAQFFCMITWIIFGKDQRSWSSSFISLHHSPVTLSLLGPMSSSVPYSQTPSAYVPPSMWEAKLHSHINNRQNQNSVLYYPSIFWTTNWKTKASGVNSSRHSLGSSALNFFTNAISIC